MYIRLAGIVMFCATMVTVLMAALAHITVTMEFPCRFCLVSSGFILIKSNGLIRK